MILTSKVYNRYIKSKNSIVSYSIKIQEIRFNRFNRAMLEAIKLETDIAFDAISFGLKNNKAFLNDYLYHKYLNRFELFYFNYIFNYFTTIDIDKEIIKDLFNSLLNEIILTYYDKRN